MAGHKLEDVNSKFGAIWYPKNNDWRDVVQLETYETNSCPSTFQVCAVKIILLLLEIKSESAWFQAINIQVANMNE